NKEIIIPAGNMIERGKALIPEEQVFFIGKISSHTHIRHARQSIGKELKRGMKGFKADQFVQYSFSPVVSAIAQDDLCLIAITILHLLDPSFTGRHTVGIR